MESYATNNQSENSVEPENRNENFSMEETQSSSLNKDSNGVNELNLKVNTLDEEINDDESQKSVVEDNLDDTNSFVEENSQTFSTSTSNADNVGIQLSD